MVNLRFALLVGLVSAVRSGATEAKAYETAIAEARHYLEANLINKVPGMSVAVAVNSSIVWQECFGFADLATQRKVTPDTRFRIASISKPITSIALITLVNEHRLDLDAPIQTYIPDYPKKEAPITLRLLAGHLSGIHGSVGKEVFSKQKFADTRAWIRAFENDPLVSPPGTQFLYTGYGWEVIELAMERASGKPFVEYLQETVFKPFGLSATTAEGYGPRPPDVTEFYEVGSNDQFIAAPTMNVVYNWAGGGLLSTATDLVHFGVHALQPDTLPDASRHLLFDSQKTLDGKPTGNGIGWFIYDKPHVLYHSGFTAGGLSVLLLLPEEHIVVAIVTNRGKINLQESDPLQFDIEAIGWQVAKPFIAKK